uniref:NADH dehydrogenase subunit 2 n=1 Tax=Parasipyloidea carinata TaxID=3126553 RepID=UPI00315CB3C9
MMNKSTQMLFMLIMMISVPISISSNSWFVTWMGMEINLMSFIPLMVEKKNMLTKEASLTYFLIQTIASMLFIISIIMMTFKDLNYSYTGEIMLLSSLMMKSGMSPFHFWLPKTMEGLNWNKCMILMTWQKIIPLMMMSNSIKMNTITLMAMLLSVAVGAIGGLNQTSLRKLMAYSSITNNGWMMSAMLMSEKTWIMYFIMYSIMTIVMTSTMNFYKNFHMNQLISMNETPMMKFLIMTNMLSISGLPPMMGFMPKWIVLQTNMTMNQFMLMNIMVMMTLITVFYYLRMMFSTMMLSSYEIKWKTNMTFKNKKTLLMLLTMTTTGLLMVTMMTMLN